MAGLPVIGGGGSPLFTYSGLPALCGGQGCCRGDEEVDEELESCAAYAQYVLDNEWNEAVITIYEGDLGCIGSPCIPDGGPYILGRRSTITGEAFWEYTDTVFDCAGTQRRLIVTLDLRCRLDAQSLAYVLPGIAATVGGEIASFNLWVGQIYLPINTAVLRTGSISGGVGQCHTSGGALASWEIL